MGDGEVGGCGDADGDPWWSRVSLLTAVEFEGIGEGENGKKQRLCSFLFFSFFSSPNTKNISTKQEESSR